MELFILSYWLVSIIYGIILPIDYYFSRWLKPPFSLESRISETLQSLLFFDIEYADSLFMAFCIVTAHVTIFQYFSNMTFLS